MCVLPLIYSDWKCDLRSVIISTKRTNKTNARCLMYVHKNKDVVIRGRLWEPDASLGALEISWGVSFKGQLENGVGLHSPLWLGLMQNAA